MNNVFGALIILVSLLLVERLVKKKGWQSVLRGGQLIAGITMILSYTYIKTDTISEWLLTSLLFGVLIGDGIVLNKSAEQQKPLIILISMSMMFWIWYGMSRYCLEEIPLALLGALIGGHMGVVNRSLERGTGHQKLLKGEMLLLIIGLLVCCLGSRNMVGPLDKPRRMVGETLKAEVQQGQIASYEIVYLPEQKLERNKVLKIKVVKRDLEGRLKEVAYYDYFKDKLQVTDMNWY